MLGEIKENRIFYYDIIRAFAIFCIVACHVSATLVVKTDLFNTKLWYYSLILNSLRDIGVPLFIALSGALLIGKKDTLIVFFKKRINRILVPYVFWALMLTLFAFMCFRANYYFLDFNFYDFILNTISLNPDGAGVYLWFIPMILTVYVIIAILNLFDGSHAKYIALTLSAIAIILLNLGILPNTKPLNYIFYFSFAIIGYYLSNIDFSRLKMFDSNRLAIVFLLMFLLLYSAEIYINATTSISLNDFSSISQFSILNVCAVGAVFLFFRFLSEKSNDFKRLRETYFGKIILSVSICSYGIYLSHIIVKLTLEYFLNPLSKSLNMSIYITSILILTFLISWILILTLSRMPVINRISGA